MMEINILNAMYQQLDSSFQEWKPHFVDVSKAFDPGRQRFDLSNTNKKRNFNTDIIDPTVTMAVRTLAGGMMSGVTNRAVPWVKLQTADEELNQFHSVRVYLDECSKRILTMLDRSNFYNVVPMIYSDIGMYSTANMLMESDPLSIIRFYHKPIGTFKIANGARYNVDTWSTEIRLSSDQIVKKFGQDNVSEQVKTAYGNRDYKSMFPVRHLIMPREKYDPTKKDNGNMPYRSVWWEPASDGKVLKESGFRTFPAVTPRWEAVGNDSYGSFGPGMLALGSARGLQKDHRQRFEAQDKMINPPLSVPSSLRGSRVSLVPGGLNYMPDNAMGAKIESVFNVNYPIGDVMNSIQDTRNIISQAFFNDLFLMVTNINKSGVTATEIAQRQEEKLLMLGPVLNRINEEFLDPVVERCFDELNRRGLLPEPPPELEGKDINVQYTSMLYQAQKLVGITALERSVSFIGNLAGANPAVLDNLNFDKIVNEYVNITGAPPQMLNDEQTVANARQQRAAQERADKIGAMAQPAQQISGAAKLLSETDVGGESALELMRNNMTGG